MKLLFLAALVATGACSWWSTNEDTPNPISQNKKFTAGNEYIYKYESQVLTGIPSISKQYSGIKIVSKARIAFSTSSDATLQLDEVQVFSMNHEIHDSQQLPIQQQISIDQFSPLPTEQARLVVERLQRPMKFRYQSGKVEEIQICSEESNWSVDIKRSIVSMLQVRLQASDFTVTQNLEYNNLEKENSTTFDVLENGLDGECYSSHHVSQSQNETSRFQVVKSRDETRCLSLNRQRKDVQPHQQRNCECEDNMNQKNCQCQPEQDERSDREETEIRTLYDIVSENRQDFLIQKAIQTVQYRHQAPYAPNQYVLTTSNQTLSLIEESEQQSISTSGCNFQTVSQPWKQQVLSQSQEKPMMSEQQLLQHIRDTLSEMVTISSDSERYEDHTAVFYQLISHLRMCNKNQLQTLFSEAKGNDNTSNNKKWKVLIDGMSYANTTVCDKVLLRKISDNEIQNKEASSMFAIWTSDKVATPTILDYMLNTVLPTLKPQANRRTTYRHAMLCFSAMTRRYLDQEQRQQSECVQESQKSLHQSNIDDCRKYQKHTESCLNDASTEEEKILCLKAVGNMGNINALPQVQRLLKRSETKAVRVQAIWAFNHLGQQDQLKTVQSLLPLMNNNQEDSEIRIAAFVMVMKCDPSSSLLAVQKQLNQENCNEFKTFVVKYLKNTLNRREPGFQQRNSRIRSVLRQVQAFQLSEQTTDIEIPMGLNGDEKNGDVLRLSFLSNQTSRFSRAGAFQQLSMTNGVRRHIAEIGYRSEGLEQIMKKFTQQSSSQTHSHSDLRALDKLQNQKNQDQTKPSITVYANVMGQEISFIHYDEAAITKMIVQGLTSNNNNGYVQIPIQFFQTIYFKPYQLRKLQPNGMNQVDETLYSGVVDIDGQLKIRMVKGETPSIRFETTKPVRKEFKTIRAQYVDAGFSICGVSGAMSVRRTINSANLTVSYFPQENKFVMNHTQPRQNNDLATQELRAYTKSFVLPQRLPQVVKSKDECFKDLKTDDSQRKQFSHQIKSLKSVELNGQIECDVDMPQLTSFVKERLHLLPTTMSSHNQLVKISIKPDTSAQRNFTLSFGGQFFNSSELEQLEAKNWDQQQQQQRQSRQHSKSGFFDYMWSSKDNQQESQQSQPISTQQFLKSDSLGSLYYFKYFTLSSEAHNQVLNMTGNMTTYYEHNYPTTRSLIRFQRPPVPSTHEREPVEFTNKMTSTVNPGNNEFIWAHNMSWGERTQSQRPNMTWTIKFTPDYKDGVCYSQTVEGCRDEFGVVYPTWYNVSHQFNYNNTNIVERLFNASRPYLYNSAQSVFTTPVFQTPEQWQQLSSKHGRYNVSQTIKPSSNRYDIRMPLNPRNPICIEMNATNIYSPLEVKFWQWMSQNQYPVSQIKQIHDYLPVHHRNNPFASRRDMCVIQAPQSYTFDRREVSMPQTDCEVILAGDCRSNNKQLMVTLKPASNQGKTAERELKVVAGTNKIQILFTPKSAFASQQMKVKVNGQEKQLNEDNQVAIVESSQQVALVQCDSIKCEVLSEKYGVYVSIDSQRVVVEVNSDKSQDMCGLCSVASQKSQKPSVSESMNQWRENKIQGSQCTIEEPSRQQQQQQDTCNKQYKHKVKTTVDENGRLQTCVSVNRLPVCSSRCDQKSIRTNSEQFRCVSQQQAQQLEITPRIEGEDLVLDDERILRRFQNAKQIQSNVNIAMSCQQ